MRKTLTLISGLLLGGLTYSQTTVTLTTSDTDIKDAWVWSYDPFENINFGEENPSNSGLNNVIRSESWIWGTTADTIRGLLSFDLSGIPTGAGIIDAKLDLFFFSNPGFTEQVGTNNLLIQRIDETWVEDEVTWINQPTTTSMSETTLPASTSTTQDYLDVDVTDLVQDMVNNPSTSDGFMLKMVTEEPFRGLTFASTEHPNVELHPVLEITYSDAVSVPDNDIANSTIQIYPIPSGDLIYMDIELDHLTQVNVEVFNTLGQKQPINLKKELNAGKHTIEMDVSGLNKGQYLVKVLKDDFVINKTILIE